MGDGRSVETTGRRLAAAGAHWLADGWPSAFVADAELRPTALGLALQTALGQPPPRSAWLAPRVGPVRVRG